MPDRSSFKLFCLGYGYTAGFLAPLAQAKGWTVAGTTRDARKVEAMRASGVQALLIKSADTFLQDSAAKATFPAQDITHLLVSLPPGDDERYLSQAVRKAFQENQSSHLSPLVWIGYLSTTGVYGDRDGAWVDEDTPPDPSGPRGKARLQSEALWQDVAATLGVPLTIFRLAGLYGPGRNVLKSVANETAVCTVKTGHVYNRIHIRDAARILLYEMQRVSRDSAPGNYPERYLEIYNVADDCPSAQADVLHFAAQIMGAPNPPEVAYENAELSPLGRAFWRDCKRVHNGKIKSKLGVSLIYPDYRAGLRSLQVEEGL